MLLCQARPVLCTRRATLGVIDADCADAVGAHDGALRFEVRRRGQNQLSATGNKRCLELFRVCQIVDQHQGTAGRKDGESGDDPSWRVGRPKRDTAAPAGPVGSQPADQGQRLLGDGFARPRNNAVFTE